MLSRTHSTFPSKKSSHCQKSPPHQNLVTLHFTLKKKETFSTFHYLPRLLPPKNHYTHRTHTHTHPERISLLAERRRGAVAALSLIRGTLSSTYSYLNDRRASERVPLMAPLKLARAERPSSSIGCGDERVSREKERDCESEGFGICNKHCG